MHPDLGVDEHTEAPEIEPVRHREVGGVGIAVGDASRQRGIATDPLLADEELEVLSALIERAVLRAEAQERRVRIASEREQHRVRRESLGLEP